MCHTFSDNSKIEELMKLYVGTYHNYTPYGKGCKNTGYRKITGNGHKLEIQSGDNGWYYQSYRDRESCIWGIHAPGARKLRVTLRVLKVRKKQIIRKRNNSVTARYKYSLHFQFIDC